MAEVLKEDAVRNSFIANINLLVQKMTLLAEVNNKFTDEEVDALVDLVAYDLQVIIDDLMKGTHNGKRKIDINLIKNLVDYKDTMSDDEKLALWSLSSNLVGYIGATIKLIDGTKFDITFDQEAFSNNDLYHQINQNLEFRDKVTGTEWLWSLEDITGGITRFVDLVTITESDSSDDISNLESITLHAHQIGENKYKEARPVYTWVDFTSALQLVAANINYIMDLLAKYPDFVYYGKFFEIVAKHIEQLLVIHEHMDELVLADDSLYKNITELKEIYKNIVQIKGVYDKLTEIVALYPILNKLVEIHEKLPELETIAFSMITLKTIFDNIGKLVGDKSIYSNLEMLQALYDKLNALLDIHTHLDHIPDELNKILETLDEVTEYINNLKSLNTTAESIDYGQSAESIYNADTNTIHFKIPGGKPGESIVIGGSLPSINDLPTDGHGIWLIDGHIWIWNPVLNTWEDQGNINLHFDLPDNVVLSDGSIKQFISLSKEFYNVLSPEEQVSDNTVFLIDDPYEQEETLPPEPLGQIEEAMTNLASLILSNKSSIDDNKLSLINLLNVVNSKASITELNNLKSIVESLEPGSGTGDGTGGLSVLQIQTMIDNSIVSKADITELNKKADKVALDEKVDKIEMQGFRQDILDSNYLFEESINDRITAIEAMLTLISTKLDEING